MKTALLALVMLFTCSAWAQEPKRLDCQEGNLRLEADFVTMRANLLEMDDFTGNEISRFGFAQRISKHHLYLMRFQPPYYLFVMNLQRGGLIKGRFKFDLTSEGVRLGEVTYEGSFGWEPIAFPECAITY